MDKHIDALLELRLGCQFDSAWSQQASEQVAALDAAIALMRGQSDMVLVPRISTETMRNVAIARYQEFADDNGPYTREGERQQMQAVWAAMIGAAPKAPAPPKDTADEQ